MDEVRIYTITEVEETTGISAFTIRYYDKCGFLPNLRRAKNGSRVFLNSDIEDLLLSDALRKSGLSIEGIQYFWKLRSSESSKLEASRILETQYSAIEYHIDEMKLSMERIKEALDGLDKVVS